MTNPKERVEQRKHKRFRAQNDTFVVLRSNDIKVGSPEEITMDGLSFHYVGREEPITEPAELSIISPNHNFQLVTIACKITSDLKSYERDPYAITVRRCAVQFVELTPLQISRLEYFIGNYTTGETKATTCPRTLVAAAAERQCIDARPGS